MTGFGTKAFTDPDDYLQPGGAAVGLVTTGHVPFGAQLSWIDMRSLRLLAIEEQAPRVAFISVPPSAVFISFPLAANAALVWNGIGLRRGELVLHAPGDRFHQRSTAAVRWGLISVSPHDLARYGKVLLDTDLSPRRTALLRPSARSAGELLRLHAQAAGLASAKPGLLARGDVARALEQDLIHALVTALATGPDDKRTRVAGPQSWFVSKTLMWDQAHRCRRSALRWGAGTDPGDCAEFLGAARSICPPAPPQPGARGAA